MFINRHTFRQAVTSCRSNSIAIFFSNFILIKKPLQKLNLMGDRIESQLAPPREIVRQVTTIAIALLLAIAVSLFGIHLIRDSDPYIQNVLTLEGHPERGRAMFEINCAGCHGIHADGDVGPSLHHISQRKSKRRLIRQVIGGQTPPMPKFQPSPQEMADLLSYLETL
jgi:mono/diheme cytochrome c family protein